MVGMGHLFEGDGVTPPGGSEQPGMLNGNHFF
jgi:hypothetical protein